MTEKPKLTSVAEARERVLSAFARLGSEQVPLAEALGRVLARALSSDVDIAPFDNSAMDGFAVRAADTVGASAESPAVLKVIEEVPAGSVARLAVEAGQATRIMTGAPMPQGADAVVKIEDTVPGHAGEQVAVRLELTSGDNVRLRGEDVRAGDDVLAAGDVIGPAAVGLAAATGNSLACVYRRPRVAILSTGDELVDVADAPGPGKIHDSNSHALAAQVSAAGGIPLRYPLVPDEAEAVREAFGQAAAEADVIVTSGGVSVGDYDVVRSVLTEEGRLEFWSVAMRPGSPQTFGEYDGVPLFGLPGNPTSAYVGFELFVRPALRLMQGFSALDRTVVSAQLTHDVAKRPGRRHYLRGRLTRAADGTLEVASAGSQSSALLSVMHRANCLMILREDVAQIRAGEQIECLRLDVEEGTP